MRTYGLISQTRIRRIREQGYTHHTDLQISNLAFGNRFAYILCSSLLTIALVTTSIPGLLIMLLVATFGFILPYHPFDYIYNYMLAKAMGKPKIPPRSEQLKFACTIASIWIATTIYLFFDGFMIAGYTMGAMLLIIAYLVSYLDFCIPSIIYKFLFLRKQKTSQNFK